MVKPDILCLQERSLTMTYAEALKVLTEGLFLGRKATPADESTALNKLIAMRMSSDAISAATGVKEHFILAAMKANAEAAEAAKANDLGKRANEYLCGMAT